MVSIILECDECHRTLEIEKCDRLLSSDCPNWYVNDDASYCLCPACGYTILDEDDI